MRSTEALKRAALAHINRRPGINQDELAVAIGLSNRTRNGIEHKGFRVIRSRNPTVKRLIEELSDSGEIWAAKDEFASKNDPLRCYPAGYRKPQLFRVNAGHRSFTECRTYFDPTIVGSHKPTQKTTFTTQERDMKRSAAQIEQDTRAAIAYFQELGRPFTQTNVRDRAGLSQDMLRARPALQEEINRAVAASKPKDAIEAHLKRHAAKAISGSVSVVPEPEDDRAALEARVAELERQNRELQEQLARQPQPQQTIGYLEGLKEEEALCKATLKRIEQDFQRLSDEFQQLEDDRKAVLANLLAIRRLISTKTGEEEPIEFELIVSANGNGHHLEASYAR